MARTALLTAALAAAVAFGAVMLLSSSESREPVRVASSTPGLEVFNRMGCGSCHRLAAAGSNGPIGPDLDERLGSHTAESLKAKIIAPGGTSVMPSDFAERMDDDELDALVSFLLASRDGGKPE
jgi:mono/diheme cytochrome c family protein